MQLMTELDPSKVRKHSLTLAVLRIKCSLYSQRALAEAVPMAESIVWQAENHQPISLSSAVKIIRTLEKRGLKVENIEDMLNAIDWVIKPPRKSPPKEK